MFSSLAQVYVWLRTPVKAYVARLPDDRGAWTLEPPDANPAAAENNGDASISSDMVTPQYGSEKIETSPISSPAAAEQGRGTTDLALFVGVAFALEGLLWLLGGWITAALGLPILVLIVTAYRLDVQPRRERLRLEAAKSVSDTKRVADADKDEAFVNEAERWAGEVTNPHLTRAQAREALIRAMEFADVFLGQGGVGVKSIGEEGKAWFSTKDSNEQSI